MSTVVVVVALALVTLTGCPDREVSRLDPVAENVEQKDLPLEVNRNVDLLFVIDNSDSMQDEQESLRANFGNFIAALETIQGGVPDIHLGVVTSDLGSLGVDIDPNCTGAGDDGQLHVGAAAITGGARYLSYIADPLTGTRITNFDQGGTVTLTTAFSQIADVGTGGCGFEQHLGAMEAALETPANGDFLRPDAHLAVIVLADEDDCTAFNPQFFGPASGALGPVDSFRCFEFGVECDEDADPRATGPRTNCRPRDPSPYLRAPRELAEYLHALKPSDGDVIVATIMGDTAPVIVGTRNVNGVDQPTLVESCTYDNPDPLADDQTADPGIRLADFVDRFGTNGLETTICDADLSDALSQVGQLVAINLDDSCIRSVLQDMIPSTPELDYECSVSMVSGPNSADHFDIVLPECTASTTETCWALVPEARCDMYPTGLALAIEHAETAPATARIVASCAVE